MSVNYLVSNPDKSEYFQIEPFGESSTCAVGSGVFVSDSYLHGYAIAYLCTGGFLGEYRARWMGDRIEYVADCSDEKYASIRNTFKDITLPILDVLCDQLFFIDEVLSRASKETFIIPVTESLLRIIDDPSLTKLRENGPFELKERWEGAVQSLRARKAAHDARCKAVGGDTTADQT